MCLLVVLHRVHPRLPLVVAANRDELLARPATAMSVLSDAEPGEGPRIVGGRDEVAGGTWLAVNEHGVVAGLTNLPAKDTARDPSRRSRGGLPLLLARHRSARGGVAAFAAQVRAADYNPAWLLCGDGEALFYLDVTRDDGPHARELSPGIHVLENRAIGEPSPKIAHVRERLDVALTLDGDALVEHLATVLSDHRVPAGAALDDGPRPPEAHAACVHAGPYGTRSATIALVGSDGALALFSADGPPCTAPFRPVTLLQAAR